MKLPSICLLSLGSLLLTVVPAARASLGSFNCVDSSGNTLVSTSISYYDLSITPAPQSGSGGVSGAGGGGVTLRPLVVHVPLSSFQTLSTLGLNGTAFAGCTLTAWVGGTYINYSLQQLSVTAVDSVAKAPDLWNIFDPEDSAYTKLSLVYGGLRIVND